MTPEVQPRLRIAVLGGIRWSLDGAPLELPDGARGRALLGWIALHPGAHPRARLAERLRPDAHDTSARATLRQAVLSVRRALGEESAAALLTVDRERFGLPEGAAWVDLVTQRELLARGELAQALALGTADPLPELDDEWAIALRAAHREQLRLALARLADAAEAAGDGERALRLSREAAQLDPLSEEALRDLLRRLALAGDRPAALAAYRAAADRLRRELGIALSASTRALAAAIERGEVDGGVEATGVAGPGGAAGAGAEAAADLDGGAAAAPLDCALPPRLARRARSPFAGREAELERLAAIWNGGRVAAPLTVIGGEPGAGKTRLAAEFARAMHGDGALVLHGSCEPDVLTHYRPLRELLDGLLRGLAPVRARALLGRHGELVALVPGAAARLGEGIAAPLVGDPDGRRWRLGEELAALFAALAEHGPVLVVLDDLQWADQPSLQLLIQLVDTLFDQPVMALATVRDTDVGPGHPLTATLDGLRRRARVPQLALGGLDETAVAALAAAWRLPAARVQELTRRSGGNPFFLELLATADPADVPAAIRDAVRARVDALGGEAAAVLTLAALAGDPFEPALLRAVDPASAVDLALEAAVAAALVVEEPGPGGLHRFRHALIRETLAAGGGAARRAASHWALADALAARGGDPAGIAHHRLAGVAAGDPAETVAAARAAATAALQALAYEDAAALLARALPVVPEGDRELRAEVLVELGRAARRAGDMATAQPAIEQAVELARSPALRTEALLTLVASRAGEARRRPGRVALLRAALAAVEAVASEAPETAEATAPGAARAAAGDGGADAARAATLRARVLSQLVVESAREEREPTSAAAVAAARAGGDPGTIARALGARRVALWAPQHAGERLPLDEEMLAIATAASDLDAEAMARGWRVVDLLELGRAGDAAAEVERHAALAERLRLPALRCFTELWRVTLAVADGDTGAASAHRAAAAALGAQVVDRDVSRFIALQSQFELVQSGRAGEVTLGRLAGESPTAAPADRPAESDPDRARRSFAAWAPLIAWTLAERGAREEARGALEAVDASGGFGGLPGGARWHAAAEAAEAVLLLEARELAAPLAALLRPFAALQPVVSWAIAVHAPTGDLLAGLDALLGDRAAAEAGWTAALEALPASGAALHRARLLERWAIALARWNEPDRARDRLDAALAALDGRDVPALRERLLAQRG
jgi:DNA-binding SARP family transcriptional activator